MSCRPKFIFHFGGLARPRCLVGCIRSHWDSPGCWADPREDDLLGLMILLRSFKGCRAESGKREPYHFLCFMQVVLNVISAPDAIVGRYKLHVNEYKAGVFFLLFNPWCSGNSEFSSVVECVPLHVQVLCDFARPTHACSQFAVAESPSHSLLFQYSPTSRRT